jgi:sulfatase modifying factor 1
MKRLLIFLLMGMMVIVSSCSQGKVGDLAFVKGGTFVNTKSNLYGKGVTIPSFYMGRYEVTQKEWVAVMGSNPSEFKGDNMPVENVSWYDCVEYCNKRSIKEGLEPYYNIDKNKRDPNNESKTDTVKWTVTNNPGANGYRLPTETEWEYAASGGQVSKNYTFSGSNDVNQVAWYWQNSGDKYLTGFWNLPAIEDNHDKTKPVGEKEPNELGLYDMSGNVREWCWNWFGDSLVNNRGSDRALRGGGWLGSDYCCASTYRESNAADTRYNDSGFRVCRSK